MEWIAHHRSRLATPAMYGFEHRVWTWVADAYAAEPVLLILTEDATKPRRLIHDETWWKDPICSLRKKHESWIYYFDDSPEDILVQWRNVSRHRMEALIGRLFEPDDLTGWDRHPTVDFPCDWGFVLV